MAKCVSLLILQEDGRYYSVNIFFKVFHVYSYMLSIRLQLNFFVAGVDEGEDQVSDGHSAVAEVGQLLFFLNGVKVGGEDRVALCGDTEEVDYGAANIRINLQQIINGNRLLHHQLPKGARER